MEAEYAVTHSFQVIRIWFFVALAGPFPRVEAFSGGYAFKEI